MSQVSGISVIVFCYNSENFIERTLRHISKQKISPDVPHELIVIDNNSKDKTWDITVTTFQTFDKSWDCKILKEEKQGLSFAREKAISSSRYEILVFVDDDNFLDDDYMMQACDFMSNHPEAGICGSQSVPEYEQEPENWFKKYESAIAIGEQGTGIEDVTNTRKFVWGAGMVIRKSLAQKAFSYGFIFINTGRRGDQLGSSEDIELCYAFIALKAKIFYNNKLRLIHHIPAFRVQWDYIKKIISGYGASTIWLDVFEWFQKGKYLQMSSSKIFVIHHLILGKNILQKGRVLISNNLDPAKVEDTKQKLVAKGRIRLFYKIKPLDYFEKVSSIKNFYSNCKQHDLP